MNSNVLPTINNNAVANTPSVVKPEDWDYTGAVKRIAGRSIKNAEMNNTRESMLLNRNGDTQGLIARCSKEWKAYYPQLLEGDSAKRIPQVFFVRIQEAVDEFISEQLCRISVENVQSFKSINKFNQRSHTWNRELVATAREAIDTKEQLLATRIEIGKLERKLKDHPSEVHDAKRRERLEQWENVLLLIKDRAAKNGELNDIVTAELRGKGYNVS